MKLCLMILCAGHIYKWELKKHSREKIIDIFRSNVVRKGGSFVEMENGAFENSEINMRGSWNQVIKTIAEMLREEE